MRLNFMKLAASALLFIGAAALLPTDAMASKPEDGKEKTLEDKYGTKLNSWKYREYVNLGYAMPVFTSSENTRSKTKMAFTLGLGNNFYLHKKPILNFMKFSIDLGLDVTYGNFDTDLGLGIDPNNNNPEYQDPAFPEDQNQGMVEEQILSYINGRHLVDLGIFVGPSLILSPVNRLQIKVYGYFVPTGSFLLSNKAADIAFLPAYKVGAEISMGRFGIGCEYADGMGGYYDISSVGKGATPLLKMRESGCRVYLSVKFGKIRRR